MSDNVDHPTHYTNRNIGYECIDITQYQTFCVGNAIKYLWRYNSKGKPAEDLSKARWYAHRASTRRETVDLRTGPCDIILHRLVSTTLGHESIAWSGLLNNEWSITLSAVDAMIERIENDTHIH